MHKSEEEPLSFEDEEVEISKKS